MSVLTSDSWLRTVSSVLTPHLPGEQSSLPSNLSLLSQFLNVSLSSELDPISLPDSTGLVIGEGTTYQVEKATIRKDTEFVAVKRTKFRFPKTRNQVLIGAGAEELYSRLRSVLLEIKTLSHPPLKNHPNIARLLGYSWDENATGYAPVLVVEFAQFGDARAFFDRVRDLSWEEKRLFCADIADGLDAVHSSMIVHGDVKLENVLVFTNPAAERRFTAKLSDFEHALLDDVVPRYGGTRIYNAPEVHRQDTDPIPVVELQLCDVFSFGLLVFEAFCDGRRYVDFKECEPFRLTHTFDNTSLRQVLPSFSPRGAKRGFTLASSQLFLCVSALPVRYQVENRVYLVTKSTQH